MPKGSFLGYFLIALLGGIVGGAVVLQYSPSAPHQPEVRYIVPGDTEESIVIAAYNKVAPSVVHITSTVLTRNFFLQIVPKEGVGSGVVVSEKGYILTNDHVIRDADSIEVTIPSGRKEKATLVGTDPSTDLAVIKIDPSDDLHVAELGDSDSLEVGMRAIAIGNPFRLDRTITVGVISALNRTLKSSNGYTITNVIQTDASINPGNSGGPLINSEGEVIGINSAIFTTSGGSIGIGFAIPINTAKMVMTQLIEKGSVAHPWIGIRGLDITSDLVDALDLPVSKGVVIVDVVPKSPAEKAGLKGSEKEVVISHMRIPVGGDIIIEIDGTEVKSMEDIVNYIAARKVGETIEIVYLRNKERFSTMLVLGRRP